MYQQILFSLHKNMLLNNSLHIVSLTSSLDHEVKWKVF